MLEDRSKPDGRRIDLRVTVLPARGRAIEPEPLVFLNGGPGISTVDAAAYASWALEESRASHDLLLVDMRGTGGSAALDLDDPSTQVAYGNQLEQDGIDGILRRVA